MVAKIKLLSTDEVAVIFDRVLKFLSEKGVKIGHRALLKTLDRAGARVDFDKEMVRFPRDFVEDLLNKAPRSFSLAAVDESYDMHLPPQTGTFYVRTNTGARGIIDPDTGTYREVRISDVRKWAQLVDSLNNIDFCGFQSPSDAPPKTADVHSLKALLENTSKHIWIQPHSEGSVKYLIDLAIAKAGGEENLRKRPIVSIISCSLTPFEFKPMDIEAILQACHHGIPIHVCCLPCAGGTSPITIAGTILVSGIEVLTQLVIAQHTKPGAPVIGTPLFHTMDMLTGKALKASLEAIQGCTAVVQFVREAYHIPTHSIGCSTDSAIPDGQSMIERSIVGLIVSHAGADILGGAGELEAATTISPIQLIVDNEITGMLRRLMSVIEVSEETMAWDDVLAISSGSHFLEQRHTLIHCREAFRPQLFMRQYRDVWSMQGGKDLILRAQEMYKELTSKGGELRLSDNTRSEMDLIVRQADQELVN